jgi:hypothetical protein
MKKYLFNDNYRKAKAHQLSNKVYYVYLLNNALNVMERF